MIALIDADSIIYIVAWAVKDLNSSDPGAQAIVQEKCESIFQYILESVKATSYIGAFSEKSCFRDEVYKVAPYKGNRGEKPDWVQGWEPFIKEYYQRKHGFIQAYLMEADDIVSWAAEQFPDTVVCSPDKDLKQVKGVLFDYKKDETFLISQEEATFNLYLQILTGDTTDNIKGLPGLGEVKAKKLLEGLTHEVDLATAVHGAFTKYYGEYYGDLIFKETKATVMMMCSAHPFWLYLSQNFEGIAPMDLPIFTTDLDMKSIEELGW